PSDTTTPPEFSTDFYIRSIEITGAAPPGVPGDYNDNGAVDAADYVIWRKLMGQNVQLKNEVAGTTPGSVTVEDYAAWRTNFGNPAGGASVQSIAGAAVPEPGGLVGLFGAIAGWLGLGRSRKNRALDQ
ncbi:MAG TPA: PEP-CTERM sorting domain-containing protein, partial [Lacipirellulaceae bacterium]|nr:PEP-CTERM sorting domain-containing protein [Lacipirellulaceae bacterium]